jgi:NADH:ubiquinone oxidoreductase subunit 4 (subunit M)
MKETKSMGFQLIELDFGIDSLSIVLLLLSGFLMLLIVLIVISLLLCNQY